MRTPQLSARLASRTFIVVSLLAISLCSMASPAKPKITVSIHPLALLVAEIAGSEAEVHTLVEPGQSPHSYQMRPSDRRRLADAELIFWVGPSLELFLQDLMSQEDLQGKSVALSPRELPEPAISGSVPDTGVHQHDHRGSHDADEPHGHGHGHSKDGYNPHIWLEPGLARQIARTISVALKETDRFDSAQIDKNLAAFEARLHETDQNLRALLSQGNNATLFTYHEAFELFAEHYGLEIAGSLTFSPEVQPGARHLSQVRDRLHAADNACVLTEPQFSRQWWRSITGDTNPTISQWDPLATDIEAKPGSYTRFLEGLAQAVLDCRAAGYQGDQ